MNHPRWLTYQQPGGSRRGLTDYLQRIQLRCNKFDLLFDLVEWPPCPQILMPRFVIALQNWDDRLVLDVVHHRKPSLDFWMLFVTRLGDGWFWLLLSLFIILFDPAGWHTSIFRSGNCISIGDSALQNFEAIIFPSAALSNSG